ASGPPPLSRMDRIAWGVAFVASAGAAVGAVWAGRRPMPDFSLLPLVLLIFSLGALLLYLVTALLSYHGGLKATPGFRLLRLISLCLALPAFGTVAGVVLQNVDRGNAEAARETIRAALERHREVQGAYPGHLEDLVPAYLPALPRARYGWDNADFVYRGPVAGDEGYRLQSPHDPE
ncbi:MAG TPA: hypothetical protein VEJ18_01880, partial [Planctomycetota bacterium]|nr:hypothetical protein [Planctomycetota bacterium]